MRIAAACIAWGIDNNLTRRHPSAPVQIAFIKGLAADGVNLTAPVAAAADATSRCGRLR
jgi:hypothetical protein